ncbi:hypothetical protein NBZ79_09370 [Sneathiella marina]|uniref:Iron uptake protein n=1 Tax=Sneathiella marina TaxID=2950108 RepID=A0ABY4WD41_9PROT|nr:hypothetical protein [Sneathiella marina]USG63184.1 hypothetical protein NBZ79_09370 [Sneathiella marina]
MFFSRHNQVKPLKGWMPSLLVLYLIAQVVSLVGFLDGFTGAEFDGRPAPLIYGAMLWVTWAMVIMFLVKSKELLQIKIGAGVLLSMPAAICVLYLWVAS